MLLLALTLACANKPAVSTTPIPDEDANVNWERVMVQLHMSEHFTRTTAARDAVIDGRLEDARVELAWLADHETFPGVPAAYGQYMDDMRAIAATGAAAKDAEGLAACIGGLGTTCAGCHQSLNIDPVIPGATGPAPANTGGLHGHKSRYGWAADQLWIGLVKPSDDSWRGGLAAAHDPPFDATDLELSEQKANTVAAYGIILTSMSQEDIDAADAGGRAELFGRVVSSCAGCHEAVREPLRVLQRGEQREDPPEDH